MLPSPDILNEFEHGKFVLANLAAKRAKQLKEGAMPLVQVDSHHPLTIALAEIAAGKIKAILSDHEDEIVIDGAEIALISDEPLPAELGMLLPALDETEVALVTSLAEDDSPDETEVDPDALSLTDLAEPDVDEEITPAEDETLSLTDIAAQENADDEEPES